MWLRRRLLPPKSYIRLFSSQAEASVKLDNFRTLESNPTNHTEAHLNRFYTIDPILRKTTLYKKSMPKQFFEGIKPFAEMCLMVREPAVEVIGYLNKTDYKRPVNRFVFYGELGCGKSLQLLHLIHYGQVNDFIIVHVPWVPYWYKVPKERSNSETRDGFLDVNIDAAEWLLHFKTQNAALLQKLDLKCSKEYVWSEHETTPAGATLLELIEHGISRIRFATDTINVLVEELKQQSTAGNCRTMVAIDGFNAFFHPKTLIKFDNRVKATPENITITQPFLSLAQSDWSGGVCLLVADKWALTKERMESDFPKYLLHRKGFEFLDPFVPIHVDLYNDQEFDSVISYYLDRKWIQNYTPGMEKELKFISGGNGYKLRGITAPL
ncbi:28S ribosomal protein S29, mitochondrial [Contarinia nasturtii]|uniref:28S ribosomal protein S29, mitochondrial n=1 Tax=Contarinia nasturtii TaxID=265458 RepID=UPI0012D3BC7E|nr:28S ribosomal protein S29, mitochondrial [Contarinia nasturtii]